MTPVHFTEPTFIGEIPAGAKMIAVGLQVMVIAPSMPPCWVTPTGLVPINAFERVSTIAAALPPTN